MKVLEYAGLDTARVRAAYTKVCEALARGDFRAAQVKKLVGPSGGGRLCGGGYPGSRS